VLQGFCKTVYPLTSTNEPGPGYRLFPVNNYLGSVGRTCKMHDTSCGLATINLTLMSLKRLLASYSLAKSTVIKISHCSKMFVILTIPFVILAMLEKRVKGHTHFTYFTLYLQCHLSDCPSHASLGQTQQNLYPKLVNDCLWVDLHHHLSNLS